MADSQGDFLQFDQAISSLKMRSAASQNEIMGVTIVGITNGNILIRLRPDAPPQPFSENLLSRRGHAPRAASNFLDDGWGSLDLNAPRHVPHSQGVSIEVFLQQPDVTVSISQAERFLAQMYRQVYGHDLLISPIEKDTVETSTLALEGRSPAGRKKVKDYENLETDAVDEMINGDGFANGGEFDNWITQRAMDHRLMVPGRTKLQDMYRNVRDRFADWQDRKANDLDASSGSRK